MKLEEEEEKVMVGAEVRRKEGTEVREGGREGR